MKTPIIAFSSNGLGENLQASAAMRWLRRTHHVILICRAPTHLVIDRNCYDQLITFTEPTVGNAVHEAKCAIASLDGPAPWTAHLDPHAAILKDLADGGFVEERRFPYGDKPMSATRAFLNRTTGHEWEDQANPEDLRMTSEPPVEKRVGDYDVMVSLGSGERMRRIPEQAAVEICNWFQAHDRRVVLHTHGDRPKGLHSKVGLAVNRWNAGTLAQLQDLIWGVQLVVSPDSGPAHLALAYGKRVIWLESREHVTDVIDEVHFPQVQLWRMVEPACDRACHARRPDPTKFAPGAEGYPFCMTCSKATDVPCLSYSKTQVEQFLAGIQM